MRITEISPGELSGSITVPPSKSIAHRAIICASLAEGTSIVENYMPSKDMEATMNGMLAMGAQIEEERDETAGSVRLIVTGGLQRKEIVEIDCIESGSTLRFLIPLALIYGERSIFTGQGRLGSRPIDPYLRIFEKQNINYLMNDKQLPIEIKGVLRSGEFVLDGNVSSQFVSGLLFSLPLLKGDSKVIIRNNLESKGYVDLTIDMLKKFGIDILNINSREFFIKGSQRYRKTEIFIEGDYSQAAFWLATGSMGKGVRCQGLSTDSLQGDKEIIEIIKKMQGRLVEGKGWVEALKSPMESIRIDVSQCPDLVPILAVLGTQSTGTMELFNGARVRIKESDRLSAISTELNKLGANIKETADGLIIIGVSKLNGGEVDSWNDHRIAMALAVAATKADGKVIIKNSGAVEKSYPGFWDDFRKLGGIADERELG